jgi:hypothetical protein
MATREQQIRLQKEPKQRPCDAGGHDEIILYPEVPPGEEDPNERVNAMERSGANAHEVAAARHNIADGSITHGNQLSRGRTPEERDQGVKGDAQHIKAICVVCRATREIDQAPNENTVVEAKDEARSSGATDQMRNNAAFSAQPGNRSIYKIPGNRAARARAIAQLFRGMSAPRPPTIIPI